MMETPWTLELQNLYRRSVRRVIGLGLLMSAVMVPAIASRASAELDSERQTTWGLETSGNSGAVATWDSLGWAVEQVGNTIYVGGNFLDVSNGSITERQPYLAAFDADDGRWQSWFTPDVGNSVLAMATSPDGGLFIGGEIDTWNGRTIGALQKIDPATGDPWPGWRTRLYGGTSVVRDLHLGDDGWMYAVGTFTTASHNGVQEAVSSAVRFNPATGAIDSTWKPQISSSAWGVTTSEVSDTIYISGRFLSVNGLANTGGFVGVNNVGAVVVNRSVVPFNGCNRIGSTYCVTMYDVEATADGTLFVGGVEHALYVLDETDNYALIKTHYAGCDPTRNLLCRPAIWFGGEFQELEEVGDRVYAVCHCWYDLFSSDSVIRHRAPVNATHSTLDTIAALDPASGERIASFRPYLTGDAGGWGIHGNEADGCLWVTGGLNTVGTTAATQRQARELVRLCDENGPGPAANPDTPPPAPVACAASAAGATGTINWDLTDGVDSVIIERQVDGGNWYWRGRVDAPTTSFNEGLRDGSVTTFRVKFRYRAGQVSAPTVCSPPINLMPALTAPTACTGSVDGTTATLNWTAGNDATSHVVYRSVNGGNTYWRGRVAVPATSLSDAIYPGSTFEYSVVAKAANGQRSDATVCTPALEVAPVDLAPVTTCGVVVADQTATISWDASANADSYIVTRSVSGGNSFWRGRVDAPGLAFDDSLQIGKRYQYAVKVKGADRSLTEATICTPDAQVEPDEIDPPASCTLSQDGATITATWDPAPGAAEYVIKRSTNGATYHWRGKVNATSFDDLLRAGEVFTYQVTARTDRGTNSSPTTCTPAVEL